MSVAEVGAEDDSHLRHSMPDENCRTSMVTTHPRVAVELGLKPVWFLPLLICRGLAVAPSTWWGLRCAVVFLGELLFAADGTLDNGAWSVEKRFRVTEVFLAMLWVESHLTIDEIYLC